MNFPPKLFCPLGQKQTFVKHSLYFDKCVLKEKRKFQNFIHDYIHLKICFCSCIVIIDQKKMAVDKVWWILNFKIKQDLEKFMTASVIFCNV